MSEWKKARKKPIVISFREPHGVVEVVDTLEGKRSAFRHDHYIIRGVEGELYPILKTIFHKTYEVIE